MPCSSGIGTQKKRHASSFSGAPKAAERQEVRERAVAELGGQREHLAAQRRDDDRDRLRRRGLELEPARAALAGEDRPQGLDRLAHPAQRLDERHPVPALDDDVRRRADAEDEAPAAGVLQRRRLLGQQRRPARVGVDDAGRQADALGDRRSHRQRREAVGPGGLAGPEVVIAGGLRAAEQVEMVAQRQAGEREGQAPADVGHGGTV
jgi:hypothetical protein